MPPADNTPDFDKMSPEEIMAWMESLAKRQGADASGFTTEANMAVPEIDPDSVVIDEPGYIPYGKDPAKWAEEEEARKKAAAEKRAAQAASQPPPPPPAAVPAPPIMAAPEEFIPEPEEETRPLFPPAEPAALPSSMSWLESLAADQGTDFSALDLSGLASEAAAEPSDVSAAPANPLQWLENLAESDGEVTQPLETPAAPNQLNWLESLAREQGGDSEEFITSADMDVSAPASSEASGPGYTPYSFETPLKETPERAPKITIPAVPSEPLFEVDPSELDDPAAWLDSLASGQGFQTAEPAAARPTPSASGMGDDDIQAALLRGENIPPEQMEAWMKRQLIAGAQRPDPEPEYDPDAPAVPAEIPGWLIDQVGQRPEAPAAAESAKPPLIEEIVEPPAVADMPDWLRESVTLDEDSALESIFDETPQAPPTPPPAAPVVSVPEPALDVSDPWVEAFDAEDEITSDAVPAWYTRNISDPSRKAAVDRLARGEEAELEEPAFPSETELPAGQPDAVPDWLSGILEEGEAVAPAEIPDWLRDEIVVEQPAAVASPVMPSVAPEDVVISDEMPDWLQAVDIEASEVPDWLTETLETQEQAISVEQQVVTPVSAPKPAPAPAPRPASPAPVAAQSASIDVAATLGSARQKITGNDLDGGLGEYERLIRANAELPTVVGDLSRLVTQYKDNPAVYRVLGDGLMRQGQLQAALDIYRKALNQL